MRIYLDTSAFVKRYCEEEGSEGSEVIDEIFENGNEIVTSYWTLAEATAAIDKKVTKGQISKEERDFVLQLFSCIVSFSPIFLASDKGLIRAAKREGLKALNVENSEERERLRRQLVRENEEG